MNRKTISVLFILLSIALPAALYAGGGNEPATGVLISTRELADMLKREEFVILDIRDLASYERGHIPGAILLPLYNVEAAAAEIRGLGRKVVTYCRCPAEEASLAAALMLREQGVGSIHILVGGYDDWVEEGRPVVTGARPF